ncbi:hypothetical protein MACH05_04290 [Qipengyuania nanhaisediminis]
MKNLVSAAAISISALALAACDNEVEEEVEEEPVAVSVDDENLYPIGGELNEDQQAAFDAMDRDAAIAEYDANRIVIEREEAEARSAASAESRSADTTATNSADTTSGDGAQAANADAATSKPLRPRSAMTFGWLDRNDDGKLSVAEYAIWALPTKPNPPEPNDQVGPHLTTDEINEAGTTFFYFDEDGDTYLSPAEFTEARNSGRYN